MTRRFQRVSFPAFIALSGLCGVVILAALGLFVGALAMAAEHRAGGGGGTQHRLLPQPARRADLHGRRSRARPRDPPRRRRGLGRTRALPRHIREAERDPERDQLSRGPLAQRPVGCAAADQLRVSDAGLERRGQGRVPSAGRIRCRPLYRQADHRARHEQANLPRLPAHLRRFGQISRRRERDGRTRLFRRFLEAADAGPVHADHALSRGRHGGPDILAGQGHRAPRRRDVRTSDRGGAGGGSGALHRRAGRPRPESIAGLGPIPSMCGSRKRMAPS